MSITAQLIRKGGRNVVKARQVLSTSEAATRQQQLLDALEGEEFPSHTPAPVIALHDGDDTDDEEEICRSTL